MTATAHATLDGTTASSGRLSSVASGVLEFIWPMYLTLVFTLGAWVLVPTVVLGWQPITIISGSMAPTVQPGHVVVVEPFSDQDLGPGTVVTYRDTTQDRLVTHRIAAVDEDGTITTKGDANAVDDPIPLTTDRIVGVGRLVVPAAGLPSLWAYHGRTDLLAVVAVLTVLSASAAASAVSTGTRTLRQRLSLRGGTRRRARLRNVGWATAALTVVAVLGATAVSRAAFVGAEENTANSFQAGSVPTPSDLNISCQVSGFLGTTRTITLTWTNVSGADFYEVDRSTTLLPDWQLRGTPNTASFTETVTPDLLDALRYRVRAVDGTWRSGNSTTSVTGTLLCL